jgi:hypothetical protein
VSTVRLGSGDGISIYLCISCDDEFSLADEGGSA